MMDPRIQAGIFAGESGGDYDAIFGYANRGDGQFAGVRPTQMTVGEVMQFTEPSGQYGQWVKGQVGHVATPIGAYQVVGTTLREAVRAGVVDPTERFDQSTQDRLGQWILQTQGTGAWEGYRGPQEPVSFGSNVPPMQNPSVGTGGYSHQSYAPTNALAGMSQPDPKIAKLNALAMLMPRSQPLQYDFRMSDRNNRLLA